MGMKHPWLRARCFGGRALAGAFRGSARGASLVELIAILFIILLLATMLNSRFSGAHRRTTRELCRKNLQLIYLACNIYANDNRGLFPFLKGAKDSEAPLSLLVPRSTTETAVFTCPASPDPPLAEGEPFAHRRISYAYYMGRSTNDPTDVILSDWQVDSSSKKKGQALFSSDGRKPGNNHAKDGGNLLLGNGETVGCGPKAAADLPIPPGVVLLNP